MVNQNRYIIDVLNVRSISTTYYKLDKSTNNHICIGKDSYNNSRYIRCVRCIKYSRFGITLKIKNIENKYSEYIKKIKINQNYKINEIL